VCHRFTSLLTDLRQILYLRLQMTSLGKSGFTKIGGLNVQLKYVTTRPVSCLSPHNQHNRFIYLFLIHFNFVSFHDRVFQTRIFFKVFHKNAVYTAISCVLYVPPICKDCMCFTSLGLPPPKRNPKVRI